MVFTQVHVFKKRNNVNLNIYKLITFAFVLSSCGVAQDVSTANSKDIAIPSGPPIEDIVTPFDDALSCMKGLVPAQLAFAVGTISDNTGKEQYADSGTGKVVTQGASDIVQSALFQAGVKVVNRRDPVIAVTETNWGIRDIKLQTPAAFFITGSINSLDFIPGGGAQVEVAGVGPRYRQNRILVGLDLSMTDTATGEVVANVPLQKQIFSKEVGFSAGRFFGPTLLSLDAGGMQREALHLTLRQMLNFATFQLLGQVVSEAGYSSCSSKIDMADGIADVNAGGTALSNRTALSRAASRDISPPTQAAQAGNPAPPAQVQTAKAKPIPAVAKKRGEEATSLAAQAIAKAEATQKAQDLTVAGNLRDEAVGFLTAAIKALREAAAMGLAGAEGDGVALVVEQAIKAVQTAQSYVETLDQVKGGGAAKPKTADPGARETTPQNAPAGMADKPLEDASQ
jgi:curli biogenesis system outer membrane secretion channel CsgG